MDNTFSKSWINMRVEYDEASRSSVLVDHLNKLSKKHEIDLIDFCCGTGSFLMWALNKNISFQNCILVDHDIKLLKSIKSNLRTHLKSKYTIQSNTNNLDLLIKKNNILYFSLCFNGLVKWTPTNTFDKYILTFFNNHQRSDKGFGNALGYKSIESLRKKAGKLNLNIRVADSPWIIKNKSEKDTVFMKRYLLDIRKSLFHMEGIDKNILRKWYEDKKYDLENKKIRLYVGHNDVLLFKK